MKRLSFSVTELALVVGTRAALAAGLGLLFGERLLKPERRRLVGRALTAVGVITTLPLLFAVFAKGRNAAGAAPVEPSERALPVE